MKSDDLAVPGFLDTSEIQASTWHKIRAQLLNHLRRSHRLNEKLLGPVETASERGKIAFIRQLIREAEGKSLKDEELWPDEMLLRRLAETDDPFASDSD